MKLWKVVYQIDTGYEILNEFVIIASESFEKVNDYFNAFVKSSVNLKGERMIVPDSVKATLLQDKGVIYYSNSK